MVVGFCEFVGLSALRDLADLAALAERCSAEADDVVTRRGGTADRVLYDRVLVRFDSSESALAALLDLRAALRKLAVEIAAGLAEGEAREPPWGRAHLVARALAQAATPGEILVDDRLHTLLGLDCEHAGVHAGVRGWRVLEHGGFERFLSGASDDRAAIDVGP